MLCLASQGRGICSALPEAQFLTQSLDIQPGYLATVFVFVLNLLSCVL